MSAMSGYLSKRTMHEEWATPASVFDPLDAEFRFTLDASALLHNAKVPRYLGPDRREEAERDALNADWSSEVVWLNPPYGYRNLAKWMRKAYEESRTGCTVVCLVPAHTGQPWWHDWVIGKASEIRWIRGKIKFVGADSCAPFPSCVVIYRPERAP